MPVNPFLSLAIPQIDRKVTFWRFEKALPEIPPALPFSKGGEVWGIDGEFLPLFSPLEKGDEGDLTAFQNGKLLPREKCQSRA
jgi:hypothetical protein